MALENFQPQIEIRKKSSPEARISRIVLEFILTFSERQETHFRFRASFGFSGFRTSDLTGGDSRDWLPVLLPYSAAAEMVQTKQDQ
jgi:hypothetical protein